MASPTDSGTERVPRWGPEVFLCGEATLVDAVKRLPLFRRESFGRTARRAQAENDYFDQVVRVDAQHPEVAVGIVSKTYELVQHWQVLQAVVEGLEMARVAERPELWQLTTVVRTTEYGSRLHATVLLPERFRWTPSDGHAIVPTVEVFNSVERSLQLEVLVGWFRFVCANGLIIGAIQTRAKRRHRAGLSVGEIPSVVRKGVRDASRQRRRLHEWQVIHVPLDVVREWVDQNVQSRWGGTSAARVFSILKDGRDCSVTYRQPGAAPSALRTAPGLRVPGANPDVCTAYSAAQALAWLVEQVRDVDSRVRRNRELSALVRTLVRRAQTPVEPSQVGVPH